MSETTISCGKQIARHADISDSEFQDVNMAKSSFDNVNLGEARFHNVNMHRVSFDDINMGGVRFHNINMSDTSFAGVNLGGAHFQHIGPAPDAQGRQERQKPITFEEMMLCDSTFRDVDMSGAKIVDCNMDGVTIDGNPVADLLAAYQRQNK